MTPSPSNCVRKVRRLEAADAATLDRCTERVITAASVDDVFAN